MEILIVFPIIVIVMQVFSLVIQLGIWTSVSRCMYYLSRIKKVAEAD